ncbi:MAG TPA: hypothetical protein PKH65_03140 [Bacteroidia bacterium]|nr:hypothetical protein [Bacteroidia bacterium]
MKRFKELKTQYELDPDDFEKDYLQVIRFGAAILSKNLIAMERLLHHEHSYFDNLTKFETLDYFKRQFKMYVPAKKMSSSFELNYCRTCEAGNPALLFHNGYWPVLENEFNLDKAIMLSFTNNKISDLSYCYGYCSPCRFEEISHLN